MRGSRNFHERGSNENGNFWSQTRGGPTLKNSEITFFLGKIFKFQGGSGPPVPPSVSAHALPALGYQPTSFHSCPDGASTSWVLSSNKGLQGVNSGLALEEHTPTSVLFKRRTLHSESYSIPIGHAACSRNLVFDAITSHSNVQLKCDSCHNLQICGFIWLIPLGPLKKLCSFRVLG